MNASELWAAVVVADSIGSTMTTLLVVFLTSHCP